MCAVGRIAGVVPQRAEVHVHVRPVPHDGVQEAAASSAVGVMAVRVAVDEQPVLAGFDAKLRPLDAGEGLERGAGGCAGTASSGNSAHNERHPRR